MVKKLRFRDIPGEPSDPSEEREEEEVTEIQLRIYPSVDGVVFDITNGANPFYLTQDDTWRMVGNLINASIMTQLMLQDGQKKIQEQQERVRKLIESGSNLKKEDERA